jgi:hypothetical protein
MSTECDYSVQFILSTNDSLCHSRPNSDHYYHNIHSHPLLKLLIYQAWYNIQSLIHVSCISYDAEIPQNQTWNLPVVKQML